MLDKLYKHWLPGQPARQWTDDQWKAAFHDWVNSLSNIELLEELTFALDGGN